MVENDLYHSLDTLLDREREALLNGDLSTISGLVIEKEQLIEQIATTDNTGRQELATLHRKALRNQELLDITLQGIRTVANRFATLRRIRKTLETYDETGKKSVVQALPPSNLERRA